MTFTTIRKYFNIILFQKLIVAAILISILSSFLAISLKHITEYLELSFLLKATKQNFLMFVFNYIMGDSYNIIKSNIILITQQVLPENFIEILKLIK